MTKGTLFLFIVFQFIIALLFCALGFVLCYKYVEAGAPKENKLIPKYSEFCIPDACRKRDDTIIKQLDKIETAPMPKQIEEPAVCLMDCNKDD